MKVLNDFEKGYLAGLLDGEGSITLAKNKEKRNRPNRSRLGYTITTCVYISNTNLNLLNKINEIYLGKIYLSGKKENQKRLMIFRWQINDKKEIVNFLTQLLPYLIVKKDRAIKMIEYCESRINRKSHKSGYTENEINLAETWVSIVPNYGTYAVN